MNSLEMALYGIRRRLIGGYGTRRYRSDSKYMPHQGAREIARRQRQAERMAAKKGGA